MCRGISWCVPGWVALQHSKHHHKRQTSTRSPTRQAEAACLCGCLPAWVVAWGAWVLQLSAHRHLKSMSAPQWKVCISPQRAHWGYREGSDPPGSPYSPLHFSGNRRINVSYMRRGKWLHCGEGRQNKKSDIKTLKSVDKLGLNLETNICKIKKDDA